MYVVCHNQARRQGGFEGVRGVIYTAIVHFKSPTGPLVSLLLRITAVQASLVAATQVCS